MTQGGNYTFTLSKIVAGGPRNIDSYYLLLRDQKTTVKLSRPIRIEQDTQDVIETVVNFRPTQLELWNFDKMLLVHKSTVDFKVQTVYKSSVYEDNLNFSIEY